MVRWPSGYGPGPVYLGGRAPDGLRTRRQLRAEGLSVAGLRPAGWLQYNAHHAVCALYDAAAARPVRPLTERQRANLAAGRALANTAPCFRCTRVRVPWWPSWRGRPCCDECTPIVAAEREAARARRIIEETKRHWQMIDRDRADAARWAAEVLADPSAVVLDTETTGLWDAVMVEIAIVTSAGEVLLDTLVNPQQTIPEDAQAIHGITDAMVADAPTFGELLPRLETVLTDRRVVIYNSPFDTGIIQNELCRLWHGPDAHDAYGEGGDHRERWAQEQECERQRGQWLARVPARIECAMEQYAAWFGDWHDYWQDYTWQPLRGGHRAAGDCAAVLDRLRTMAAGGSEVPGPLAATPA